MSKKSIGSNYLSALKKKELEEQLIDLYQRFPTVKEYYDFVFNPKETRWCRRAKLKDIEWYFPLKKKKGPAPEGLVPKKYIKALIKLGVDSAFNRRPYVVQPRVAQSFFP